MGYFLYDCFWRYAVKASIVASQARLVAIDAARTAREVCLYGMRDVLVPSHKTCVGMGGSPDADHGGSHK